MDKVINLPKKVIDEIFERSSNSAIPHQADVIVELYRLVIPVWDEVKKIDGWPIVTKKTSEYLFRKFMDFDDKHHPTVLRGGLWMNNGFSSNMELVPIELEDFD